MMKIVLKVCLRFSNGAYTFRYFLMVLYDVFKRKGREVVPGFQIQIFPERKPSQVIGHYFSP